MVDDKDIDGVMKLLPTNATYYFTKANNKRAIPEEILLKKGTQAGLDGRAVPTVPTAYKMVMNTASDDDFVFVGGSSYVVADFLKNCI